MAEPAQVGQECIDAFVPSGFFTLLSVRHNPGFFNFLYSMAIVVLAGFLRAYRQHSQFGYSGLM